MTRLAKNSAYRAVHLQLVIMCVSQRAMCCKFKETSALTVDSSGIDLAVGNMERIKEQPSALRHAPLTNILKLLCQAYTNTVERRLSELIKTMGGSDK